VAAVTKSGSANEALDVRRLNVTTFKALWTTTHKCDYLYFGRDPVSHRLILPSTYTFKSFSIPRFRVSSGGISFHRKPPMVQVGHIVPGERKLSIRRYSLSDLLQEIQRGVMDTVFVAALDTPLARARLTEPELVTTPNAVGEPVSEGAVENAKEPRNRELLLKAQSDMLASTPMLTSEQLAERYGSTTTNASQLGQDLRGAGRLFGVRSGKSWHYPAFQLDGSGKPFEEMTKVLSSLGKDERGWAYLKWFLEPNFKLLSGATPLATWLQGERNKVVEAARMEHWHDRD